MKAPPVRSALLTGMVLGLTVILAVLAVLQYRWIGQVSEADRERMEINLGTAVAQFRQDLYAEFARVGVEFRPNPGSVAARDWDYFAHQYENFARTSTRAELVSDFFLWEADYRGAPRLLRFNQVKARLEPAEWPSGMQDLQPHLIVRAEQQRRTDRREFRRPAWTLDEGIPALLHPLIEYSQPVMERDLAPGRVVGYIVLRLDLEFLRNRLLPELVARHFGGSARFTYRVEIIDPGGPDRVIFSSEPALPVLSAASADASVRLFGEPPGSFPRLPLEPVPAGGRIGRGQRGPSGMRGPLMLAPEYGEGRWQLIVKYRAGSLSAVVASLRLRNLALSFGVLLLLAISMTMIIVFTHRAQRLAKIQMDFVAGVSHELRTPLAVICSAADNLAAGFVAPEPPVRQYGELIRNEGRRLTTMVEQILLFAGPKPSQRYELRPVGVADAIDAALADAAPMLESAGFSVEKDVPAGLPPALADESGLQQCLQNLISNAVKYGGERRWVGVRARLNEEATGSEIQITVEDRGLGIEEHELRLVFQPFFRGEAAKATQARGTGLGLNIVKDIAEAMGGRVTVSSVSAYGSAFTLHLAVGQA
jgi:signal transduction histidine kinase